MSSALLAALFAILGTGLAVTSAACVVLWRRVLALTSASVVVPFPRLKTRHLIPLESGEAEGLSSSPLLPGEGPGVRVAASPPRPGRVGLALPRSMTRQGKPYPTGIHDPHPGPLPGGEGGRRTTSGIEDEELARRLDELSGKYRALEARLARVEASATGAAAPAPAPGAIASRPSRLRPSRRVDSGSSATSAGPTLISVPDLAAPPASNSEAAAELDRRFGPVWAMADEGMPIDAIARETGYPIGQVELILGLRRRLLVAEAGPDA